MVLVFLMILKDKINHFHDNCQEISEETITPILNIRTREREKKTASCKRFCIYCDKKKPRNLAECRKNRIFAEV
jgi:hypothetical protein